MAVTKPKNNLTERLYDISNCCDKAYETLSDINTKVVQIIAYKKDSSKDTGTTQAGIDKLMRRQLSDFMVALEKLGRINENLNKAAQDVKQLCEEAHLLLGRGYEAKKGAGLGMGGSTTEPEEDVNERGSGK